MARSKTNRAPRRRPRPRPVASHSREDHSSSAKMTVESFKLVLLPVWMTELSFGGRGHLVLINGQNGIAASDLPDKKAKKGGLMEWLGDLLEE